VIANPTSVTAGDLRFYDTANVTTATCSSVAGVVWNVPAPTNSTAANVAGWSIPIPTDLVFYNGVAFCHRERLGRAGLQSRVEHT